MIVLNLVVKVIIKTMDKIALKGEINSQSNYQRDINTKQ